MIARIVCGVGRGVGVRALSSHPTVWSSLHGRFPIEVKMSQPMPGIPEVTGLPSDPIQTEITTLPNGIKVATDNNPSLHSAVGVFANAGTCRETRDTEGCSLLLQHAAFKDTANSSHFRNVRVLESIGATGMSAAHRDHFAITSDCHTDFVQTALELLADSTLNPSLTDFHFSKIMSAAEADAQKGANDAASAVNDAVHQAAFGTSGLGNTPFPLGVSNRTPEDVARFHKMFIDQGSQLVVAASGVEHNPFVHWVSDFFGSVGSSTVEAPKSSFTGGYATSNARGDGLTHFAVGFQSVPWENKDIVPTVVLSLLLGGGDAFSSGGPGKGMTSILYENILNGHHYAASALASTSAYSHDGIFLLQGAAVAGHAADQTQAMIGELKKVASNVSEANLERAKNTTISHLLGNAEAGFVNVDDMGRQLLYGTTRVSPAEYLNQIKAVTAADISAVAKKMLSGPFAYAVAGEVGGIPNYDQVANMLR